MICMLFLNFWCFGAPLGISWAYGPCTYVCTAVVRIEIQPIYFAVHLVFTGTRTYVKRANFSLLGERRERPYLCWLVPKP